MNSPGAALTRVLTIAGLTLREAARRRVILAAVVMSAAFLVLYGLAAHFAAAEMLGAGSSGGMSDIMRAGVSVQLLYLGLFPAGFLVALTALFAGAGTVSGELDSGVIYAVLARPVRRAEVVVGKFLGLAVIVAAYAAAFYGAVIVIARWQMGVPLTQWWLALLVLVLEPMPLLAIAVLGSTRLPTLANGVVGVALYGLGFIGGLIESLGALLKNPTMVNLGIVSSLIMPLDALHRLALSLLVPPGLLVLQNGGVPGTGGGTTPSMWMAVYALLYVGAAVWAASLAFSKRDL